MKSTERPYEYGKMKRRLKCAAAAAVVLLVALVLLVVKYAFAGDQAIPINSLDELQKIGRDAEYPLDGDYVLTADLDGNKAEGMLTVSGIGTEEQPFKGSLDGQGHEIRNLLITRKNADTFPKGDGSPLFYAAQGSIRNLVLNQVIIGKEDKEQENTDRKGNVSSSTEVTGKSGDDRKNNRSDDAKEKETKIKVRNSGDNQKETSEARGGKARTDEKVVKISTWEQFVHIGDTAYHPDYTMDADYVLINKIASDGKKFTPIGTKEKPFCGTFDGQDYPIDLSKNPEIHTGNSYGGLFGAVKEPGKNE